MIRDALQSIWASLTMAKAITPNVSGMPVQPINFAPENESYGGTD